MQIEPHLALRWRCKPLTHCVALYLPSSPLTGFRAPYWGRVQQAGFTLWPAETQQVEKHGRDVETKQRFSSPELCSCSSYYFLSTLIIERRTFVLHHEAAPCVSVWGEMFQMPPASFCQHSHKIQACSSRSEAVSCTSTSPRWRRFITFSFPILQMFRFLARKEQMSLWCKLSICQESIYAKVWYVEIYWGLMLQHKLVKVV